MTADHTTTLPPDRTDAIVGLMVFFVMVVLIGIVLVDLWPIRDEAWPLVTVFGAFGLVALAHAWVGRREEPPRTDDPPTCERILRLRNWQKSLRKVALLGVVTYNVLWSFVGDGASSADLTTLLDRTTLDGTTLSALTTTATLVSGVGLLFCVYTGGLALRYGRDALDLSHGVAGLVAAPTLFALLPAISLIELHADLPSFDAVLLWLF